MGSEPDGADFPLSQPMRRITADMFDDDEIERCLAFEEEEELRRASEIEAQWNQEVAWTEIGYCRFFLILLNSSTCTPLVEILVSNPDSILLLCNLRHLCV